MDQPKIKPEKITKPIQLLAVWFAGLVLLVGLLLTGAKTITIPYWIPGLLTISAVIIIPLFLYFVFLLQTKFRPQMQEDSFYSTYLDRTTNTYVSEVSSDNSIMVIEELQKQILSLSESNKIVLHEIDSLIKSQSQSAPVKIEQIENLLKTTSIDVAKAEEAAINSSFTVWLNRLLSHFEEIRVEIFKKGYDNYAEFQGSSNLPPKEFIVSFGKNVTAEFLRDIIILLRPFGLKGVNAISETFAHKHANNVVIGSYAIKSKTSITSPITDSLIETLNNVNSLESLQKIFKK
jgi:hypothetical protein